jgi:hypothetical protein
MLSSFLRKLFKKNNIEQELKILYLPFNIGSMQAYTAEAINKIENCQAKYITYTSSNYSTSNSCEISINAIEKKAIFSKEPIKYFIYLWYKLYFRLVYIFIVLKYMIWCDVVHFVFEPIMPSSIDVKLAKWLGKKRFVEWVGSDIRIPEITSKESETYRQIHKEGFEYNESIKKSYKNQALFSKYGYTPILVPEMQIFINTDFFNKIFTTQYRIKTGIKPQDVNNSRLVFLHCPSKLKIKGSYIIEPIMYELEKEYNITYKRLTNVSRDTVLNEMAKADIYIDQIVLGSYASAAIEAMSMGKPTIAYIMPSVYQKGIPTYCPIVNAKADNLREKLIELIENPELRRKIGIASYEYATTFHDPDRLAKELLEIYRS